MTNAHIYRAILVGSLSLIALGVMSKGWGEEDADLSSTQASTDADDPPANITRVTVEAARRQAEILHTAVHSTLQVVHHRYYREDEGLPIVAATLREVFADLESEENVSLRWLTVEGQVMNTEHRAQNQFDLDAVEALSSGDTAFEQVEDGFYRRAGAITLTNQCLKCHVPDRTSTEDRTAGLIIAIPVPEP